MEYIKRKVGYEDFNRTKNLVVTSTTLNFPIFLKQDFEDIGLYTDVENPVYEVVDLSGFWNLSNDGSGQKPCLNLNNCSATITSTPISFFGGSDGSINASINSGCPGTPTYSWTGPNGFMSNSLSISNLRTGNYTLKIIDGNCDISYVSYYLQQPQALYNNVQTVNSQTNATVGCNGSASVTPGGGQPPYTYTWYSGSTIIAGPSTTITGLTNLCAGVYTVQITDSVPVTISNVFTITEPSAVSGTVVTTGNIDCNGGNTGTIVLSAAGGIAPTGYTYVLSGPMNVTNTNGTFNNLMAGTYTATIYDGVGNSTIVGPIVLTQPVVLTFTNTASNVTCYGDENGSIVFTPGGGTPPYSVNIQRNSIPLISLSLTGPYSLNNLDVGSYTATIEDNNGCVGPSISQTLYQRPVFNMSTPNYPTYSGYIIACFGDSVVGTYSIYYTTDGTTIPGFVTTYPINWYVDDTLVGTVYSTSTNLTLTAGTYTIKAEDPAGCIVESEVTITQPPYPLTIVGGIDYIEGLTGCTGGCTPLTCRQAIVNVNGGVGPYTIDWYMMPGNVSWGSGITSNKYCASEGAYTSLNVTITDGNGCTVTDSILV